MHGIVVFDNKIRPGNYQIPFGEGIGTTASWLFKGSPLYLRILTLLFTLISVTLGAIVWQNIGATNDVMMRALTSPLVSTPNPNSAIEALLLASIQEPASPPPSAEPNATSQAPTQALPTTSGDFQNDFKTFQDNLSSSAKAIDDDFQEVKKRKADSSQEHIQLAVLEGDRGQSLSTHILSDEKDGFLFIAGAILDATRWETDASNFDLSHRDNPSLYRDVALSREIALELCDTLSEKYSTDSKGGKTIFDKAPDSIGSKFQQSYVIFKTGVTRMCEAGKTPDSMTQRAYYSDKFPANTYLEQRPYFLETAQRKDRYLTDEYFDLAGNGVIRTYCQYLSVDREDAVLCFDFLVSTDIAAPIRSQVTRFGGTATQLICNNSACVEDHTHEEQTLPSRIAAIFYPSFRFTPDDLKDINSTYSSATSRNEKANLIGKVTLIDSNPKPGIIKLAVPTKDYILAVKVDLGS